IISSGITAKSGRMNITVDYHQTNQKTNTGKTLKPWPILVDHYSLITHQTYVKRFIRRMR
ncbi:hypothetical protein, partial [Providencia rettgeri]|uniref:hypothetical protein n=1 Tax=Providencia rettgeri TaxID=587 RepID=UPI00385781D3